MSFPLEREGARSPELGGAAPSFVIVGGAPEVSPERLARLVPPGALVVAADGGWRLCRAMSLCPSELVGDFDTLSPEEVEQARAEGTNVHAFSSEKDQSDLELAILRAHEMGARRLSLLGALGGQWDHCLANLLAPLSLCHALGVWARLVALEAEIYLLPPGRYELRAAPGTRVSLAALSVAAEDVDLIGLRYPLLKGRLARHQTLGLANQVVENPAAIRLGSGELLLTLTREDEATVSRDWRPGPG